MDKNAASQHVAVVIPCYNAEDWIGRAIDSVLLHPCQPLSIVVVDDGSTDRSVERVRAYGDAVTLECGKNRGACHARNRGLHLAMAAGAAYVVFLDADDYLEGEILQGAATTAQQTKADIVLSNMHPENRRGQRRERFRYTGHVEPRTLFEGWMRGDYVNPSAILWRAGFVKEIGGWDETLSRAQDLDITLRATLEEPVIWKNEQGAAIHPWANTASISNNFSRHATESRLRVQKKLLARVQGTPFATYVPLLCREIYSISRTAFRTGQTDLGREGMALLRVQNYRTHPGSLVHSLAASIFGLEKKVRLWGA